MELGMLKLLPAEIEQQIYKFTFSHPCADIFKNETTACLNYIKDDIEFSRKYFQYYDLFNCISHCRVCKKRGRKVIYCSEYNYICKPCVEKLERY